jgi:hypothetical protein
LYVAVLDPIAEGGGKFANRGVAGDAFPRGDDMVRVWLEAFR